MGKLILVRRHLYIEMARRWNRTGDGRKRVNIRLSVIRTHDWCRNELHTMGSTSHLYLKHQGSGSAAAENYAVRGESGLTLYAIYQAPVSSSREMAVIFCDDGSNTTFISWDGIKKAKKLAKTTLEITTLNGTETVSTSIYEVVIVTASGRKVPIKAIELSKLTDVVSQLDGKVLSSIFPDFDVNILQRSSAPVDILLGGDYFSLHPKRELASDSKNLSIMQGELGVCVQGSHPGSVSQRRRTIM